MPPRTKFLSRLIGLYCLVISLVMAFEKQAIVAIRNTFVQNPAMLFLLGILTLVAGLAIVLAHNQWSGGALPVVVTLLGWTALIKGLLLSIPQATVALWSHLQYERLFYVYVGIAFALGVYLTYAGFAAPRIVDTHRDRQRLAA